MPLLSPHCVPAQDHANKRCDIIRAQGRGFRQGGHNKLRNTLAIEPMAGRANVAVDRASGSDRRAGGCWFGRGRARAGCILLISGNRLEIGLAYVRGRKAYHLTHGSGRGGDAVIGPLRGTRRCPQYSMCRAPGGYHWLCSGPPALYRAPSQGAFRLVSTKKCGTPRNGKAFTVTATSTST